MTGIGDTADTRSVVVEFRWAASPLTLALATCAALGFAAAIIGARWQLIAFVAPLVGVMCTIRWQRAPARAHLHARPALTR
jgi:hypothetical protein